MNRSLLFSTALGVTASVMAQAPKHATRNLSKPVLPSEAPIHRNDAGLRGGGGIFWTENFSGGMPSGWTNQDLGTPAGQPNVIFQWSDDPTDVEVAAVSHLHMAQFNCPDAQNGYLWANSDRGLGSAPAEDHITQLTTSAIDCSGQSTVQLRYQAVIGVFELNASTNALIQVSTDGSTWTDFQPFPCLVTGNPLPPCSRFSANPTEVQLDITSVAANQPTVYLRWKWTGGWEYYYAIDDVRLMPQPEYELQMLSSFLSHTGKGEEYARLPSGQLNPTMLIGADIQNFGSVAQNDVTVQTVVSGPSSFTVDAGPVSILASESGLVQAVQSIGTLSNGLYTAVSTLASAQEDFDPSNNSNDRWFQLTDAVYALDGLTNPPAEDAAFGVIGTASFADVTDGMVVATYYELRAPLTVYGIEVGLVGTHTPGLYFPTIAGGAMSVMLLDSSNINFTETGDMTIPPAPIHSSVDLIDVSQAHVDLGVVRMELLNNLGQQGVLLPAGGYYAGAELYGNGDSNPIRILDDISVGQPDATTAFWDPVGNDNGPQWFINGNAAAIRLLLEPFDPLEGLGIKDNELAGVNMFPNPTTGNFAITMAKPGVYTVEVMNVLGKRVLNTRTVGERTDLDMSGYAAGVYMVRISDGTATTVKRLTVK